MPASDDYDAEARSPHLVESRRHYDALNAVLDVERAVPNVSYGNHPRERMDIFMAGGSKSPVMLFFHGGYWKAGSKESRRFPARTFTAHGVTWVTIEYPILPDAAIESIVASSRRAVAWAFQNIARFGGDPEKIFACGNSAGGHLVAMLAVSGWAQAFGLDANPVKGVTAISPLADLRVFVAHPFNEIFRLTRQDAERISPALLDIEANTPLIVAVGALETPAFHWQSRVLMEHRASRGARNDRSLIISGRDHMSIIGDLDNSDCALTTAIFEQMEIRNPKISSLGPSG